MRLLKPISALLSVKYAKNNEAFSSAKQTSLPPLSTKGGKLELTPKTAILTADHNFSGFDAFIKSDLLCFRS